MKKLGIVLGIGVAISACSGKSDGDGQFTLASGVTLAKVAQCSTVAESTELKISRTPDGYRVTAAAFFGCETEFEPPYLSLAKDDRATLVLLPKRRGALGFGNACECSRVVAIDVAGRLEAGQTLYVLNDHEVIGHTRVP